MKFQNYYLIFLIGIGCNSTSDYGDEYIFPNAEAIVHVTVPHDLSDTVYFEVAGLTNIPRGNFVADTQIILSTGEYYAPFYLDRYTISSLRLNDWYNILAAPGDTVHIVLEEKNDSVLPTFTDRFKLENEYFLKKKNTFGYTDIRYPINQLITSRSTYQSVCNTIDSITQTELDFLTTYLENDKLHQKFIDLERAQIKYMQAGYKTALPKDNNALGLFTDTLSANYFYFLEDVEIVNPSAILSYNYLRFLSSYFIRDLPSSVYSNSAGKNKISIMYSHYLKNSQKELHGTVKEVYHQYLFSFLVQYYSDSLMIDSLAKAFEVADYHKFLTLSNKKNDQVVNKSTIYVGDTIPNFYFVDEKDSLVSIRDFDDKIVYINIWATWCAPCIKNFPELNTLISSYENQPQISFINLCYGSKKEGWINKIKEYNISGTNLFVEGAWNKKLNTTFGMKGVPHYLILNKGNVLYENFSDKAPNVKPSLESIIRE